MFCEVFVWVMVEWVLDCYVVIMSKVKCGGVIFIDWLCNMWGVISVCLWLLCVCDFVGVVVLLCWDELVCINVVDVFFMGKVLVCVKWLKVDFWYGIVWLK